jgi:hypothetical protein
MVRLPLIVGVIDGGVGSQIELNVPLTGAALNRATAKESLGPGCQL